MSGLSPECAPKGTSAGAYGFTSTALVGLPLARDGFELNRLAVPYLVGRISGHVPVPGMRARQPVFAETVSSAPPRQPSGSQLARRDAEHRRGGLIQYRCNPSF